MADAHAQDASAQAEGRALFDEGVKLLAAKDYARACPKLEASLKRYSGLGTRGKLAECYEKAGRTASAWATYKEVAALASKAGDATRAEVAASRAAALEGSLAKLVIALPPANDAKGLVVKKDGETVERAVLGTAVSLDPGEVVLEVSAPGRKPRSVTVTIEPGKTTTAEIPALEGIPVVEEPRPLPVVVDEGNTWQRPLGLGIAGAGVVSLVVGSVLGLSARSAYEGAFDSGACERATKLCSQAGQSQIDGARGKATLSTVFVIAGAALAGGGAVLYFTAPSRKDRASVGVTPIAGGASVSVAAAF